MKSSESGEALREERASLERRLSELDASFSSEDSLLERLRREAGAAAARAAGATGDGSGGGGGGLTESRRGSAAVEIPRGRRGSFGAAGGAGGRPSRRRSLSATDRSLTRSFGELWRDERFPTAAAAAGGGGVGAGGEGGLVRGAAHSDADIAAAAAAVDVMLPLVGTPVPEPNASEDILELKKEERRLQLELQGLRQAQKREAEEQEALSLRLETAASALGLQRRAVRALRMRVRDHEAQLRALQHWLRVAARVAFDRERDRAHALLQRAVAALRRAAAAQDRWHTRARAAAARFAARASEAAELAAAREDAAAQVAALTAEVAALREREAREAAELAARRARVEAEFRSSLAAEEAMRRAEAALLAEARERQRPGNPVDVDELEVFEAVKKDLKKVPNLREAVRLQHVNLEGNRIQSARGLEYLGTLTSLNLNGLAKCKELVVLDLSSNPIADLEFVPENKGILVLDLHSTQIQDYASLARLNTLLYLDLSRVKIMAFDRSLVAGCTTLQWLNLSRNGLSSVPELANFMLRVLLLENNFIKLSTGHYTTLHVSVVSWLPRLRHLNLAGNKIESIDSLALCPNLEELLLANNEIQDKKTLFGIAACRKLRVLDLSKNPISTLAMFRPLCHILLPKLQVLNAEELSGVNHTAVPALHAATIIREALELHSLEVDPEQPESLCVKNMQQTIELWEDFSRICVNNQTHIDDYMGEEYEPYLKYLGSERPEPPRSLAKRLAVQEARMSWLAGLLSQFAAEVTAFARHGHMRSRLFSEVIAWEDLCWRREEWQLVFAQCCLRR
ncbi:hypothetical protein HK405_006066, partial [Cladochytrium tenue]